MSSDVLYLFFLIILEIFSITYTNFYSYELFTTNHEEKKILQKKKFLKKMLGLSYIFRMYETKNQLKILIFHVECVYDACIDKQSQNLVNSYKDLIQNHLHNHVWYQMLQ